MYIDDLELTKHKEVIDFANDCYDALMAHLGDEEFFTLDIYKGATPSGKKRGCTVSLTRPREYDVKQMAQVIVQFTKDCVTSKNVPISVWYKEHKLGYNKFKPLQVCAE